MAQPTLQPSRAALQPRGGAAGLLGLLGRSLLTGLGYTLVVVVAGGIAGMTGLPAPALASRFDPRQLLALTFLAGVLAGLTLGPLATRLHFSGLGRAGALFALAFLVQNLASQIEALFFTTYIREGLAFTILDGALNAAGLGILLVLLFPPGAERRSRAAARSAVARRSAAGWAWRFILAGLAYVPIYLLFGSLVAPAVVPYYRDPALGLGLVLPGYEVILPLEMVRGLLFAAAALPLVVGLRGSRRSLAFWIGLSFAVLGSWVPMLQGTWLPPVLRVLHGLEITADSFVHGSIIAWLLGPSGDGGPEA